jgi:hypothetical protein
VGGPVSAPVLIERSRILLTSAPLPCEPYHNAKRGGSDDAERIVAVAAEEARVLATEAITSLTASLKKRGQELLASGVVLGGGKPGTSMSRALSTHAAMHGAEGWLFREALLEASQKCGLATVGVQERELTARAAEALGCSESSLSEVVQQLGRDLDPPWRRDQKAATMAALVAMRSASSRAPS